MQKTSGKIERIYCQEMRLNLYTFRYYKKILFASKLKKSPFVQLLPAVVPKAQLSLQFNGLTLTFEEGHDPKKIAELCSLLRSQG
jgi:hypothetical protein